MEIEMKPNIFIPEIPVISDNLSSHTFKKECSWVLSGEIFMFIILFAIGWRIMAIFLAVSYA